MLSLIIPCYNCASYIDAHVKILLEYLKSHFSTYELILVDDGSTDETLAHVKRWQHEQGVKVISFTHNRGKGAAVKAGVLASHGEYIIFTDADVPYGTEIFETIVNKLKEGFDVVLGARLDDGTVRGQKSHRTLLSRVFAFLANLTLLHGVPDTQAGIKGFTKRAAGETFPLVSVQRFCFDVEVIAIAQKKGLHILSTPVQLQQQEVSTVRVGSDGFRMLTDLVRIFFKWRL